jgi:enoyl-CoA hydratase
MSDVVTLAIADRVATITLNRPQARNALSREVRRLLPRIMAEADANVDVDAVVLTGADPAFCAGLDLKELGAGDATLMDAGAAGGGSGEHPSRPTGPFPPMTKPVIGAINGVAITGGLELALACDFLVASDQARFADTHARVGIQPGWGLTVLLPQAVGLRRAREMSATGNFVDASTALAWGLVNHVVPHGELLELAHRLATDIASNDARAVRTIYATYDEGSMVTAGEAWALETRTAAAWQGGGIDPTEIERRRALVADRGRKQL